MFGILGKAGGLRVNSADPRTLKAIEKTKADALADLREYDSMANSPELTPEQKHFFRNCRESYMSVVETGYCLMILIRLAKLLPSDLQGMLYIPAETDLVKVSFSGNNKLAKVAIFGAGQSIKELARAGKLRLDGTAGTPMSQCGTDFIDDGFKYADNTHFMGHLFSIVNTGARIIEDALNRHNRKNLTAEQALYHSFEARNLTVCLKEHLRSCVYTALLPSDVAGQMHDVADMLTKNSVNRTDIALSLVSLLAEYGVLSVQKENALC